MIITAYFRLALRKWIKLEREPNQLKAILKETICKIALTLRRLNEQDTNIHHIIARNLTVGISNL